MKVQVRKGCFETNSSSTHAICISKENVDINKLPKHVSFTHGEFGWEEEVHTDIWSKASYLYQAICDCCYSKDDLRQEKLKLLEGLLNNYGISCDFEPDKKNSWGYSEGYIDHGCETEDFVNAVLEDPDKLLRFLFGDSMIVTGNDNDDWFTEFMYVDPDDYDYTFKEKFEKYEIYEKGN